MLAFFCSLYTSLLTGTWEYITFPQARTLVISQWEKTTGFLMNALGGNFETAQSIGSWNALDLLVAILSITTIVGIALATWKIIKGVLSIFFEGWR